MISLTVPKGMTFGFIISVSAALLFFAFGVSVAVVPLLKLLIAGCTVAYLCYLLKHSDTRVGAWVTVCSWLLTTATVHYVSPSLTLFACAQLGFVWLVRTLYHHQGFIAAMLDLLLAGAGFAAAVWTAHETHSLFLSLWSFFLIQALFVLIPNQSQRSTASPASSVFDSAQRTAEAALRRLSQNQTI